MTRSPGQGVLIPGQTRTPNVQCDSPPYLLPLARATVPNPYLPSETLDYIVGLLLCDRPETLKECCLVSKSFVSRTRKPSVRRDQVPFRRRPKVMNGNLLGSVGPPCISYPQLVRSLCGGFHGDGSPYGVDCLLKTFPHVVRLELAIPANLCRPEIPHPVPQGSTRLQVNFLRRLQMFDLIRSSSPLEDLALMGHDGSQSDLPSTSPTFWAL